MTATIAPGGDLDIATAAGVFADPTRARVLMALSDGRALPASVLAAEAAVTPQAASTQLSRLTDAGLLTVERSGRHRYYRLATGQVATVLEALAQLAPMQPVRSLRHSTRAAQLRAARTCYDHLAGRLGVQITQALIDTASRCRDLPAATRPDRHRPLHQHPPDRLIRYPQVLTHVVQRPPVSVQDDRLINLRLGHDRPSLARTGNVPGDRRAMKVVDLRQLADASTGLILRDRGLLHPRGVMRAGERGGHYVPVYDPEALDGRWNPPPARRGR